MNNMFLILIEAHTKWIEAKPLSSITSTSTIQCLRTIFSTFGLPEVIVTDNGPSFVSEEFETFLRNNGIQHKKTPPYHPSSNGLDERAVQIFKRGMKNMKKGSLQDKISRFLFSYRNTPQGTTGSTPAQLLMGRTPRSPFDLLRPDLSRRVNKEQEQQKFYYDQHSQLKKKCLQSIVLSLHRASS